MKTPLLTLVITFLIVAAFFVGRATAPEKKTVERKPRGESPEIVVLKERLRDTERELEATRAVNESVRAELEKTRPAVPPPTVDPTPTVAETTHPAPPTDEEVTEALKRFGSRLQQIIVGAPEGEQAAAELRALLARARPERIAKMIEMFQDATQDHGARIVLAHALAQSGRPEGLEVLQEQLRDPDSGMVMQRFAAHALAFSPAEGLETFLTQIARESTDRGVRANASFGLIRRDVEEGVELYFAATDDAFEANDPAALQYLSGFAIMGDKGVPGLRERLTTYKNQQAVLVIIEILKGKNDVASIPELEKLAYDANQPAAVQKSAQGALDVLKKAQEAK